MAVKVNSSPIARGKGGESMVLLAASAVIGARSTFTGTSTEFVTLPRVISHLYVPLSVICVSSIVKVELVPTAVEASPLYHWYVGPSPPLGERDRESLSPTVRLVTPVMDGRAEPQGKLVRS